MSLGLIGIVFICIAVVLNVVVDSVQLGCESLVEVGVEVPVIGFIIGVNLIAVRDFHQALKQKIVVWVHRERQASRVVYEFWNLFGTVGIELKQVARLFQFTNFFELNLLAGTMKADPGQAGFLQKLKRV